MRVLAVFGVAAAVVVVIVYGLTRGNWLPGVLAGIATAMALLPEEFPVVLTVFMALGAWRMSQKHVLTAPAVAWPATPILVGLVQWQQEQAKTVSHCRRDQGRRTQRRGRAVRCRSTMR